MTDILATAEAEIAELDRKISELQPLIQRRDQLRSFVSIGRMLYAAQPEQSSLLNESREPPSHDTAQAPEARNGHKPETMKTRVVEAAAAILAAESPMRTRELLARLQAQGIEVGGANKIDTVSVILSRSKDRFRPNRATGWTLRPQKERPR